MLTLIRGAGDIASGIAVRLIRSGMTVIMTETDTPMTIRRTVAFSTAVREKTCMVEDIEGVLANGISEAVNIARTGRAAVVIDPECDIHRALRPQILVDSILAKKNLGTNRSMGGTVIGVGPGFEAGADCHAVIETMRGHDLGRVIYMGKAIENTGIPGEIMGYSELRVQRAPIDGVMESIASIGDTVIAGDGLFRVNTMLVRAPIAGVVRGMLADGIYVTKGTKLSDIDPRARKEHCFSVSDKARAVGGGVLEAIMHFENLS